MARNELVLVIAHEIHVAIPGLNLIRLRIKYHLIGICQILLAVSVAQDVGYETSIVYFEGGRPRQVLKVEYVEGCLDEGRQQQDLGQDKSEHPALPARFPRLAHTVLHKFSFALHYFFFSFF